MDIPDPKIQRGSTVLVMFKATEEKMTIRRPAVIMNVDLINDEVIILPLTSKVGKDVPPEKCLHLKADTWEGRATGLRTDVVIDCRYLGRIPISLVVSKIGKFDENIMQKLDKLVED